MATSPSSYKLGIVRLTAGWPTYIDGKTTHRGVDIVCGVGSLDRSICVEDSRVMKVIPGDSETSGTIELLGVSGHTVIYKHMGIFRIAVDDEIPEGAILATPNLTNTDSLHLHFEVWVKNKNVNPLEYLFGVQPDLKYEMSARFQVDKFYKNYHPDMYQELSKRGNK